MLGPAAGELGLRHAGARFLRAAGEKNVCGRGQVVTGQMRVADVAGALDWLNAQPFVRKDDIGLIGHSHGGWTTMRAVQGNFGLAQRGLQGGGRLLSVLLGRNSTATSRCRC